MDEAEIKLKDVYRILKKHWNIIAVTTFLITFIVTIISLFFLKPVYEANTKVFIGNEETIKKDYDNNDVQMYQKLVKTYSELIKTNDLIEKSINKNNLELAGTDVIKNLEVTPITDSQILQVSYRNRNSALAQEVLSDIMDEFIEKTKELIPNGTVKIIESPKSSDYPVSPNKKVNIIAAFFIGLIIGSLIAILKEYSNDTFKAKEEVEKEMDLPVIGMIPCSDGK